MDANLAYILIPLIAIVVVSIAIVIYYRKKNNAAKSDEFLKGIGESLYQSVLKDVLTIDITKINNREDLNEAIQNIYKNALESGKNYIKDEIVNVGSENPVLGNILDKAIDDNTVEYFIQQVIEDKETTQNIVAEWEEHRINEVGDEIVAEDKKLEEIYSNQSIYIEEIDLSKDLEPAKEEKPTEEDLKKLNPRVEEDSDILDINDPTIEIIEENK